MYVVTRKVSEELVIGQNVRIVVLEIAGRQVKLGIEAPDDVEIKRVER
ncbi:MAG: carbon storage regulator [Candidatus Eremiobacteraeota bacterium]|nr:carbon storage regulator [Candidatus Eremiobacteraeota bacterium]